MRAIGYFREGNDKGQSLAEQSHLFLEFCQANGYQALATFLEPIQDDSGNSGYWQMVEFLKSQGQQSFLMVAVSTLKALGITLPEAARHYFQITSLGVRMMKIDDGSDPGESLVKLWSEEQKGKGMGQRVRAAMRRKAVKGEVLGRPPYGYEVGPRRRLRIIPEEGSVVRYIFRLYLKDGLGIRRIARRLNEENLRTRRGGLWSMVTIRDILRNRAYVGTYSRLGVKVPASHAPLISSADFRQVQDRLDNRRPVATTRQGQFRFSCRASPTADIAAARRLALLAGNVGCAGKTERRCPLNIDTISVVPKLTGVFVSTTRGERKSWRRMFGVGCWEREEYHARRW